MLRTRVMAGPTAGTVLAIVLATALTTLYCVDLLVPRWRVRPGEPAPITLRLPGTNRIAPRGTGGITTLDVEWHMRRLIIARGTTVTDPEIASVVNAYEDFRRPLRPHFVLGVFAMYFLTSLLLFTYLRVFAPGTGRLLRTQMGLFALVLVVSVLAKALLLFTPLSEYYLPVSVVPLWAAMFIERRAALLLNVVLAFLMASFARYDIVLIAVFLARGMATAIAFRGRKSPRSMVAAGLGGGVVGALMLVAAQFYFNGTFHLEADLRAGVESTLIACISGGLVAGLVAWLFVNPAVIALGAVSRSQLMDLNDLHHPLLKRMADEAPGSWQHARAMANLAEGAAAAIGADALLTRTGAYFHDLGKTIQCKYFVENLDAGERSPHEDLDPDVSADAIMTHVVGGAKILRDAGIPEPVVEFAYTHHGTSVIEFFWHKCQQQGNPKHLSEDAFRYPGMKPHTRETAILMLVDAIEAASRTIDPPERPKFEEMIQRVIFSKMKQGQLDESGLNIHDVRVLVTSIAETLVKVYHHRIKYPWQHESGAARTSLVSREPVPPVPAAARPSEAPRASEPPQHSEPHDSPEGPRASDPPPPPDLPAVHTPSTATLPPLAGGSDPRGT